MNSSNPANQSQLQMDPQISHQQSLNLKINFQTQQNLKDQKEKISFTKKKSIRVLELPSIKESKIPETMKQFLKQKRIVSSFMTDSSKKVNPTDNNTKQNDETLQQIIEHESGLKQLKLNSLKALQQFQNNNKMVPQLAKNQGIRLVCEICEGKIEKSMFNKNIFDCVHVFCKECTKSYLQFKIKMFELIYCPNQGCKATLNQRSSFYCEQISLKQRKKYLRVSRFLQIHNSNQPKRLCPKQNCEGLIAINDDLPIQKCNVCAFQLCTKCFAPTHDGQCENYESKYMKQSFNLVDCQKCKNFIEKSEGCHHITCKCGYEFCQRCKQPWNKRHICKYTGLTNSQQGWGGCDWGITQRDHFLFLLKLPLKFFLIIVCSLGWIIFSFFGVPLNILLLIYWVYLLFVKPSWEMIRKEQKIWKIFLYVLFFPLFLVINTCEGKQHLIAHIDGLMPEISNSFRWIVRL